MKNKYTPGPWSAHPFSDNDPATVIATDGSTFLAMDLCIGAGDKRLATAHMIAPSKGYPSVDNVAECQANAALITAAPDLLRLVETMDVILRGTGPLYADGEFAAEVRAIVAKAAGEAQ